MMLIKGEKKPPVRSLLLLLWSSPFVFSLLLPSAFFFFFFFQLKFATNHILGHILEKIFEVSPFYKMGPTSKVFFFFFGVKNPFYLIYIKVLVRLFVGR